MGNLNSSETPSKPKMPINVSVPETLLQPPMHQPNLILETLNLDIFIRIFSKLDISDLASFCQANKTCSSMVQSYCRHTCKIGQRHEKALEFLKKNSNLLLPVEMHLKDKLESLDVIHGGGNERSIYTLMDVQASKLLADCDRVSALGPGCWPCHYSEDNRSYLRHKMDANLKRKILFVDSVCWLQIRAGFDGGPGNYNASVRIRVGDNFRWPSGPPMKFRCGQEFKEPGANHKELMCCLIEPEWWKEMRDKRFVLSKLKNATLEYEEDNWIRITLDTVVNEESNLAVEILDIDNQWWKSGLEFDFFEIRKI